MPEIGFRFQPGADSRMQPRNGEAQGTTVPQESIRTLSLRVPQTQSVPGIAPLPLLNATGGGGSDLDMLLRALLRAFGPSALQGDMSRGPGGGRIAAPRVTPGYVPDPNEPPMEFPLPPAAEPQPPELPEATRDPSDPPGVFRMPNTPWRPPQEFPPYGRSPQPRVEDARGQLFHGTGITPLF